MYGRTNVIKRAVLQVYQEHFSQRRMSDHRIFKRLELQLCWSGFFHIIIYEVRENWTEWSLGGSILNFVADMSKSSARTLENNVDILQANVLRTLMKIDFIPSIFREYKLRIMKIILCTWTSFSGFCNNVIAAEFYSLNYIYTWGNAYNRVCI